VPGTNKTGTIAVAETWVLDGSPYNVTGDLTIDATVDVEPGVEIVVYENKIITVNAGKRFWLGGTRSGPISIHGRKGGYAAWNSIMLNSAVADAGQAQLFMDHVHARDAIRCIYPRANVNNYAGDVYVKDSVISDNDIGIAALEGGYLRLVVERTIFERNRIALVPNIASTRTWLDSLIMNQQAPVVNRYHLYRNIFRHNQVGAIDVTSFYANAVNAPLWLENRFYENGQFALNIPNAVDMSFVKAEKNWWGSDSGPLEATGNPNGTGDKILIGGGGAAAPDYTPWWKMGRYVPDPDRLRTYLSGILRLADLPGGESRANLLTDDELNSILDRADDEQDSWYTEEDPKIGTDGKPKRLFTFDTITNEKRDIDPDSTWFLTDFWPILVVTNVQYKTGTPSTYSANVANDESSGWYSSVEEMRKGKVRLMQRTYRFDGARITYDKGFKTIPTDIEAATLRLAARDVLQSLEPSGEAPAYTGRMGALEKEIAGLQKTLVAKYGRRFRYA
jgi:hypothetical protein